MKQICSNPGHSNIGITFDTCSHVLSGAGKTAAKRLDKFLKPWLSGENVAKMSLKQDGSDTRLEGFEPTTLGSED